MLKDQSIRLYAEDVPSLKAMKRELKNVPNARCIGAALRGWRYLSPEQKLAALTGKNLPVPEQSVA